MQTISSKTKVILCLFLITRSVKGLELPSDCKSGEYYEPGVMECQQCPANASMVTSADGFSCSCEGHSIPVSPTRCKPCGATEVVSSDGRACVPRKCQKINGKIVCRRCPTDYIAVTQNVDGSPTKEVQCVKCARGYKAENNTCVRCDACVCTRNMSVVAGRCVPKKFMNERPKYEEDRIHPSVLLDVVKNEYFCLQNDVLACRSLANTCVRNIYSTLAAGPCRLWIQPKFTPPKGLPQLTIESTTMDNNPGEFALEKRTKNLTITVMVHTSEGGMKTFNNPNANWISCILPVNIIIGVDFSHDCSFNTSDIESSYFNDTLSPYLYINGIYKPIPVSDVRKPNGQLVKKAVWSTTNFRRFFLIDNALSIVTNSTETMYLRKLIIHLQIARETQKSGSLPVRITIEVQYATKSPLVSIVTTTLSVDNDLPSAGIPRGMEIWGGILGAFLSLYAIVQWRGAMRRGALQTSLMPLLCGSVADALYFAAWFSTLHALAAETTLGLTLPLSKSEETVVKAFVYSAVCLKAVKLAWINWKQSQCDIFFLDWAEYNPPVKDSHSTNKSSTWKADFLAHEWCQTQTKRRACPGYTVVLTLVLLQLMLPWRTHLPPSATYQWAVATICWVAAYATVLLIRWTVDKVLGPPTSRIPRICAGVEMSLLVFQEEYYAHYVHGRAVYKQLSTPGLINLGETDTKQALLSRFLAAFFERALDGLSWVASERTMLERLLDVELVVRENGNTSALLYDPDGDSVSCFALTWWGEEWNLSTFDAMLFGSIYVASRDSLAAALATVVIWQVMEKVRRWIGDKNVRQKTNIY